MDQPVDIVRSMSGAHDMGGTRGHGSVVAEIHEPVYHEPWEGRVYGMMRRLLAAGLFNLDQFRHAVERLPPTQYLQSSYYQRWLAALELLVRETGAVIRTPQLPESHAQPAFRPGDRVVTRDAGVPGHTRLPRYAGVKHGVVESVHGPFRLPDTRALGSSIDWQPVYTVVFEARELWGPQADPNARVSVDLWQSYLGREDK
jgi:nitrile hydratase